MSQLRNILKNVYFNTINRKLLSSYKNYSFSDETAKFTHILEAINYLRIAGDDGNVLPQTYYEFGCHSGRTFSAAMNASKLLKMKNFKSFAFDSFQGLPETDDEDGYFKKGTFHTSEEKFKNIIKQSTGQVLGPEQVISGFYEKSLTPELCQRLPKIGALHIDVDLYSSTVEVLTFVRELLVSGSVILFDDYYCFNPDKPAGELRALNEFLEAHTEFGIIPWKAYSTFGQSFFIKKAY